MFLFIKGVRRAEKRDKIRPWPFVLMPKTLQSQAHRSRCMCNQLNDLLRLNSIVSHLYLSRGQIFFLVTFFSFLYCFCPATSLGREKGPCGGVVNGAGNLINSNCNDLEFISSFYYFYCRFMDFVSLKYRLLLLLVHGCRCLSSLPFKYLRASL